MVIRLLRVMVIGVMTLAVGVGTATHAYAVPSPEELEQQIEAKWRQIEPVIEEINALNDQLAANRAKAQALQNQLQPLTAQVDAAMGQVRRIAVSSYMGGRMGAVNVLLGSNSPTQAIDTLGRLNILARNQRAQVNDAAGISQKLNDEKKALDQLISQQAAREAELAKMKTDTEAQIAELERMQRAAGGGGNRTGTGGGGGTGGAGAASCTPNGVGEPAATAVRVACAQLGKMYLRNAAGPDRFDCSGLTQFAWKAAGKSLVHNAAAQYTNSVQFHDPSQLRPGDLIFFYSPISHMGMYVGQGWMVHASQTGKPISMKNVSSDKSIVGYGRVKGT